MEKTEDKLHHLADDRGLAKPENAVPRKEEEILNQEEQQIEDREEEIRNIEKSMAELNDLFRDVSQITSEQGEQLSSITENVATVSNSGVTPSASKGKEVEDEARQRRRAQNKLAQRKFREKAREQARERREYDMKAETWTQYKQGQDVESEDLGMSELSGLPWGGVSMRHVVARGHDSSARGTSPYVAHPETSQPALQMPKSRTPGGNVPKGNSGSQKQVRFDFGLEQGSVQTEMIKPRLDLHISDSVARAIQSAKQTEQPGPRSNTSVGFSEAFTLPSDFPQSSVRPKSRFETFFDHLDDQRQTSDDSQQIPQSAWDNLLEKLGPSKRPRNRDRKATSSTGKIASFEHGDTDTSGNNGELRNENLTEEPVEDKDGKGKGPSNERSSLSSDAGAEAEGPENEVDDEVDELLKEWTTVLG
jgi:hypothetical protein